MTAESSVGHKAARRARPPAGDPLETDADRSHRDWESNWNDVTGATDLSTLTSRALHRAHSFGANRKMREHLKAQQGLPWNQSLVASIDVELYAIDQVLRSRGEIGAAPAPTAAAPAAAEIAKSPRTPEESAAHFAAARARIGPDRPPADPNAPLASDFAAHLKRIRNLDAARLEAFGPVGDIAIGKSTSADQWKMVLADVDGGGRWRTQTFDADGFSGHELYKDKAEALAAVARHHYLRDDGALDRLQDTPRFQRGLFTADLIRRVNAGELAYTAVNQQLEAYDAGVAVAAVAPDGSTSQPSRETSMNMAFGITEDDVLAVLHKHSLVVANTDGRTFEQMASDLFASIDGDAVEKAALYGDGMDEQTDYAHAEIRRQLQVSGVIEADRPSGIDAALEHLVSLVEGGMEFPDAQWKATQKFGVDAQELSDAYDARDLARGTPRG